MCGEGTTEDAAQHDDNNTEGVSLDAFLSYVWHSAGDQNIISAINKHFH